MTMTSKGKRLANTDIEISQHALVTFMMSLFAVLNNFKSAIISVISRPIVLMFFFSHCNPVCPTLVN